MPIFLGYHCFQNSLPLRFGLEILRKVLLPCYKRQKLMYERDAKGKITCTRTKLYQVLKYKDNENKIVMMCIFLLGLSSMKPECNFHLQTCPAFFF